MGSLFKQHGKTIRIVVTVACVLTIVYCAAMITLKQIDSVRSKREYENIKKIYYVSTSPSTTPITASPPSSAAAAEPAPELSPETQQGQSEPEPVNFTLLKERNSDIVGWLKVPNTIIDYPVVQADNNDYYLGRSFERKKSAAGAIFMDYRNEVQTLSGNIVLYGHRMRDGTMFKALVNYLDRDFFFENRTITFDTLEAPQQWEAISVYETDTSYNYIQTTFEDKKEYVDFLKGIQKKSRIRTDTALSDEDVILTLSTCSYSYDDARLVVHFRLLQQSAS